MEDIHYNSLLIKRFINQPVPSNTFLIIHKNTLTCIVIDSGSKDSYEVINYVKENSLSLEYIILTHEHFDHVWGVNSLKQAFPSSKIIASITCSDVLKIPSNYYNRLYFDSSEYYSINDVDIKITNNIYSIIWNEIIIKFILTPGHSKSSMCISVDNILFTGDTIMFGYKPLLLKRHNASFEDFKNSVELLFNTFPRDTLVLPGHGSIFKLHQVYDYYMSYISKFSVGKK